MIGKPLISLLIFCSMTVGCAEPNYVVDTTSDGHQKVSPQADCSLAFAKSKLCLFWYWEKQPTDKLPGSLVFKSYRLSVLDKTPIEMNLERPPKVVLWMPGMGHGSTPTEVSHLDTGTYRASKVFFIMPGEWEIKFQLINGDEIVDEVIVSLNI